MPGMRQKNGGGKNTGGNEPGGAHRAGSNAGDDFILASRNLIKRVCQTKK